MEKSLLCIFLALCGNSLVYAQFNFDRPEGRYGQGSDAMGANDAEVGQLSGIFNSLVNELQSAPKLAEGPQAQAAREANERRRPPAIPPVTVAVTVTENPAATDAPPEDSPTPDPKSAPVNNKLSRFTDAGMNANNYNPQPSGPFPGANTNPMMYPPMQPNQGPGPYDNPFNPNPYNNNYGGNDYQQAPPQPPPGNPGSYGPDNSALQEQGLGQLGQFFSSMVGELQNSGFNNNVESAINPNPRRQSKPAKSVKPVVVPVSASTAASDKTTSTASPDDDKQ